MATKKGYTPIYACIAIAGVTLVYSFASSIYLRNRIETLQSASDQVAATEKQTEAITELTKALREFVKVMRP